MSRKGTKTGNLRVVKNKRKKTVKKASKPKVTTLQLAPSVSHKLIGIQKSINEFTALKNSTLETVVDTLGITSGRVKLAPDHKSITVTE